MIRIRLFGTLEMAKADGTPVLSVLSQPKRLALLAYVLTAHPRGFHSRDKLMALFWPEADEEHARNSLRQSLHFLRRSLGEDSIISRGEDLGANDALFSCDVLEFAEAGEREDWAAALALYRGPFLEGFHLSGSPGFGAWLDAQRERLRVAAAKAAEELVRRGRSEADLTGAVEAARRWVQLSPGSGRAIGELIRLLAQRGDRAGALRTFESFRERLWTDFGLEPAEDLDRVIEEIRQGTHVSRTTPPEDSAAAGEGPTIPGPSSVPTRDPPPPKPASPLPQRDSPPPTPVSLPPRPDSPSPAPASLPPKPTSPPPAPARPPGRTARWTIIAFVAMIALGYGLFFISRPDRRTPVRLTGFQDLRPSSAATPLPAELVTEMREVMEGSEVIRPVTDESGFRYLQSGSVVLDTVRLALADLDPEADPVLRQSHPFREPLSEDEVVDLATLLVQDIERAVAGRAHLPPVRRVTANLAASQAYLEGRALWALRDPDQFLEARRSFEEAVRADSTFALAYAALADVFNLLGAYDYGVLHPDSAYRLAKSAADRAYSLDPDLAEAQAALATTRFFYEWDYAGADALYRGALRLDPTYEHGHHWRSLLLAAQKNFDLALSQIQQALQEDSSEVILSARARIHYFARDFRQALTWYDRALEVGDDFVPAYLGKGLTALAAGEFETARVAYEDAERHLGGPKPVTLAVRGHLMAETGDTAGARQMLGALEAARARYPFVPPEYLAMVHLGLGEHARAMDYLEEAFENGSNVMTILAVEPILDPLRSDPRFLALMDRVRRGRIR